MKFLEKTVSNVTFCELLYLKNCTSLSKVLLVHQIGSGYQGFQSCLFRKV